MKLLNSDKIIDWLLENSHLLELCKSADYSDDKYYLGQLVMLDKVLCAIKEDWFDFNDLNPSTNFDWVHTLDSDDLAKIIMCPYDIDDGLKLDNRPCLTEDHKCMECCAAWLLSHRYNDGGSYDKS